MSDPGHRIGDGTSENLCQSVVVPHQTIRTKGDSVQGFEPSKLQNMRREEEYTETSGSEEYSESDEYIDSLFGNMKTTIVWDAADKQLSVNLRQYVESARKVGGS